jgi:hypothetical protein
MGLALVDLLVPQNHNGNNDAEQDDQAEENPENDVED